MRYSPFRNKVIRLLPQRSARERLEALAQAGYNVARLPGCDVPIDLLSDSGQSALSDRQWAAMMRGDEAYAGSRSFHELEEAIRHVFGLPYTIPAHQGRAAENLLATLLLKPGMTVWCNPLERSTRRIIAHAGAALAEVALPSAWDADDPYPFKGDLDLARLGEAMGPGVVWLSATSGPNGGQPLSLANLTAASAWAHERGLAVVLDASRLHQNAWLVKQREPACRGLTAVAIARKLAACVDYLYLSGKKIGHATIGGLVALKDSTSSERLRNLCVIFEGMPFYGGMAGRDMGALAVGLQEAFDERALAYHEASVLLLFERLQQGGVPMVAPAGGHGVFIDSARFAPGWGPTASASLVAWLYALSGVRAGGVDHPQHGAWVRLAWNARRYDRSQLEWAAEAVLALHAMRDRLSALEMDGTFASIPLGEPRFSVAAPPAAGLMASLAPQPLAPYQSKVVEVAPDLDTARREAALKAAGYNMYLMRADEVEVDLFTDSGTNAMSDEAWASMWPTDESLRGAPAYERFVAAVQATYGFEYVLPAHQGRGAEALLSEAMVSKERPIVIGNESFITTLGHILRCGGRFVDVTIDEAYRMQSENPFKGNLDLEKLQAAIDAHGRDRIAYLNVAVTLNASGGQPVSMDNLRAVGALARAHGLPLYLDATRAVENAWFIQQREPGYGKRPLHELLRELCREADGVTVSGKKDLLVNIGGFLATRDRALAERASIVSERIEGFVTSGGLAYRDLAAMTQGLGEMLDEAYMTHRIHQAQELGARLRAAGIPIVEPIGGHAVFVDAEAFLPRLSRDEHPGHALAAELYRTSGVRGMRVKSPFDVQGARRGVELLRLALPRRVYAAEDLQRAAEALQALHARSDSIRGLEVESEPVAMRATLSRYRPLGGRA